MTLTIDSNEAQDERSEILLHYIKQHFPNYRVSNLPVDFKLEVNGKDRWVERKIVPNDLLASVTDGRLVRQGNFLSQNEGFLLLEGRIEYDATGRVVVGGRV